MIIAKIAATVAITSAIVAFVTATVGNPYNLQKNTAEDIGVAATMVGFASLAISLLAAVWGL